MYLHFYGLLEPPFGGTPDPKFLYRSAAHRDTLAQLTYGVREGKGFMLMTGEVGTGKTTLVHALLRRLERNTAAAFVFNSTLPFEGLLEYIVEDLGIGKVGASHAQRLFALNNFLLERYRTGQNTLLIIDEAQNLPPATLEELRLLSNFETPIAKLLQILLVGQPELAAMLALPELRQLSQRLAIRCMLRPLSVTETAEYVRERLRIAGARGLDLFTDEAIHLVARYSGGIPRMVNSLCDHCLLIGYADQKRHITHDIVEEAHAYFRADTARLTGRVHARGWLSGTRRRWAIGTTATAIAAGFVAAVMYLDTAPLMDLALGVAHSARELLTR